ncbi:MAG TPA: hypothetical protein PKE45_25825, partial [Caldilineaceae bacterium]|nr:hypothetical protein [Caldilineaceae bacterium]
MPIDPLQLTQDLVAIPSPSTASNRQIADFLADLLRGLGFEVERLAYDDQGAEKVSLVARLGPGTGGLGLFSHSDTVPGDAGEWE